MSQKQTVIIIESVVFLEALAVGLDKMVEETRRGGWSTHQSERQTQIANDCRRKASRLRTAFDLIELPMLSKP